MTRTLALALAIAAIAALPALAQDGGTADDPEVLDGPAASDTVTTLAVGSVTEYSLDYTEPVILYVDRTVIDPENQLFQPRLFFCQEDGQCWALTRCDDVYTPCEPLPWLRLGGVFADAPQGASFGLRRLP